MSSNPAVTVLANALGGISMAARPADPETPDLSAETIEETGPHSVATTIVLPSGDRYRISVEWLAESSP